MKIISMLGIPLGIVVLLIGLRMSTDNLSMFLDNPSLFIVIGGTLAASIITYRLDRILVLLKIFFKHISGANNIDYTQLVKEIILIGEAYRKGSTIESQMGKVKDHFLKESLGLIADGILSPEEVIDILEERNDNLNYIRLDEANKIKTLAQFPPAFGMMGTTIGMIVLLSNLGGEDALKMIGPSMSICLITTLYGVVLANLGFIPVAENLIDSTKAETLKNSIIIEGTKLILNKTNPVLKHPMHVIWFRRK